MVKVKKEQQINKTRKQQFYSQFYMFMCIGSQKWQPTTFLGHGYSLVCKNKNWHGIAKIILLKAHIACKLMSAVYPSTSLLFQIALNPVMKSSNFIGASYLTCEYVLKSGTVEYRRTTIQLKPVGLQLGNKSTHCRRCQSCYITIKTIHENEDKGRGQNI